MVTIKKVDDQYIMDVDGTDSVLEVKQPKGWDETIVLPENPTNRKLINKAVADKKLEEHPEGFELTVKAARAPGQTTSLAIPSKKLLEYLPDDLKEEAMAIIERARQAYEAQKSRPLTEQEKLMAKIARMQKQIEEMEKAAANVEEEVE